MTPRLLGTALAALSIAMVSACGTAAEGRGGSNDKLSVVAAFYPLEFAAKQIGGTHVSIRSLTKPGAEPHDLELTPKDVVALTTAKVVVYEKSLQPAVDDAVAQEAGDAGFDVAPVAHLELTATDEEHGGEGSGNTPDPHFWLDPVKYAAVATAIGDRLAAVDPANAADYTANAKTFVAKLNSLNDEFATGLAHCKNTELVTGHAAFGYLAKRYGLQQEGIAGVSPDIEPNASAMKRIAEDIRAKHVTTVYAETLVSPALSETIARETGATVKVLDPIEGVTKKSAGRDYFEIMRSNLATLRTGQSCT